MARAGAGARAGADILTIAGAGAGPKRNGSITLKDCMQQLPQQEQLQSARHLVPQWSTILSFLTAPLLHWKIRGAAHSESL